MLKVTAGYRLVNGPSAPGKGLDRGPIPEDRLSGLLGRAARLLALLLLGLTRGAALLGACWGCGHLTAPLMALTVVFPRYCVASWRQQARFMTILRRFRRGVEVSQQEYVHIQVILSHGPSNDRPCGRESHADGKDGPSRNRADPVCIGGRCCTAAIFRTFAEAVRLFL